MGKPNDDTRGVSRQNHGIVLSSRCCCPHGAAQRMLELTREVGVGQTCSCGSSDHHEIPIPRRLVTVASEPLADPSFDACSHHGIPDPTAHGDSEPRAAAAGVCCSVRKEEYE